MWVYDLETLAFLAVNDVAIKKYGYSRDEFLARTIKDIRPAEDVAELLDNVAGITSGLDEAGVWRHQLKNGQSIWVRITSHTLTFDGRPSEVVLAQDVTDQLRAEGVLRESEERLRFALAAGRMGTFDWDVLSDRIVWSDTHYEMFGYPPGERFEVEFRHFADRLHPDDRPVVERTIEEAKEQGTPYSNETRIVLPDGSVRWVMGSGEFRYDSSGRAVRMLGTVIDITERKRAEESLRASEIRYRMLFETSSDAIFLVGLDGRIESANPAAARMHGYTINELLAMRMQDLDLPNSAAELPDRMRRLRNGETLTFEVAHRRKDGTTFPMEVLASAVEIGGEWFVLAFDRDITDRKLGEESLRASEERFRQAFEYSGVGMALVSPDGQFLRVNTSLQSILGYTEVELLHTDCVTVTAPDDRAADKQWVEPMLAGRMDRHSLEKRYLHSDGRVVWALLTVSIVRDDVDVPSYFVAQFQDVTARRAAELAVRESEERLRIFVENAPVGVAMLDRELRYISYSRRWLTDYGLGDQNLVGRSHYEVFPEVTDRWKEIHRRCLTGVSEHCERDRFDREDGTTDYLRWEIQPWYNAAGEVGGLVFFTEVITDRVNAEEQVKASLLEKESLLQEVHHRVKNNLQIITSLLNLQAETIQDPTTLRLLRESQNRVRSMALVHETLYRSGDFGRIDLASYVDDICTFLSRAYGIDNSNIRIEVEVDDVSLDLDRAIPCGLIINELVSNALKYAFPENRNGRITVRLTSNSDQVYTLIVKDDGVGLPPDVDLSKLKSLGLQLVNDLVRQLTGSIVIEPAPGAGFFIHFPTKFPQEQRP